jgi:nicotinate-nucleotide pyrophosphorylase (carboxylating)
MIPPAHPPWSLVDPILDRALEEDLAGGDVTSESCVEPHVRAKASLVARGDVVVCGAEIARRAFEKLAGKDLRFEGESSEGTRASKDDVILRVEGPARALLMAERVALNFVQRLSGVATLTRAFVDALPKGSKTRIADTRKTTPGLRILERYAVRCGGGHNHRDMLGSAVLIKDNHLVAAGGVAPAIERARALAPHTSKIECEVESLAQLREALDAGADVVLLDNMNDTTTKQAIEIVRKNKGDRVIVEVSGGIAIDRVRTLASLGVDVVSVGALTHSAPAADVALALNL